MKSQPERFSFMEIYDTLHEHLSLSCPEIHAHRLQAVMDVAEGLQRGGDLSLTGMGRGMKSDAQVKHRIKKVDRLESNAHLHGELSRIYEGLSRYVFHYVSYHVATPVIVDLCYIQDNRDYQMLSAELAVKGRSLPLYREVFKSGELKGRSAGFLSRLSNCLPSNVDVIVVMDAGFGESWLNAISERGWYWLLRVRSGKQVKLSAKDDWRTIQSLVATISTRAKSYNESLLMKDYHRPCRIVTKRLSPSTRNRPSKRQRNDKAGNDSYRDSANEPWVLATNVPLSFTTSQIVSYYRKRMQIEESFRDLKSPRFGLSARYASTGCVYRWSVKMLLAAIVQVVVWTVGVVAHAQGFQRVFQANTVKDRKVFSYFYLGQLVIQYDKLGELNMEPNNIPSIMQEELAVKT
jgi:hypothetical protein